MKMKFFFFVTIFLFFIQNRNCLIVLNKISENYNIEEPKEEFKELNNNNNNKMDKFIGNNYESSPNTYTNPNSNNLPEKTFHGIGDEKTYYHGRFL